MNQYNISYLNHDETCGDFLRSCTITAANPIECLKQFYSMYPTAVFYGMKLIEI